MVKKIAQKAIDAVFYKFSPPAPERPRPKNTDDLSPRAMAVPRSIISDFTGDKFPGGFGVTQLFTPDYWTLRERSAQLFTENLYARGLIRRLITNEINTGLTPEASPDEEIIGLPEDSLSGWTESTENRFAIWGNNSATCDYYEQSTFGAIQRTARLEALVEGDVLVVLRVSQKTKLPSVQLIRGKKVQSPFDAASKVRKGHKIIDGVELDQKGRHVAFWVTQEDGDSKRLPAFGEKSGRRIAWMVYGTERRLGEVRGTPLLSLMLQSLKEIDRYRDSTQRKAVINSILAMFIEKTAERVGTLPVQGGAVRNTKTEVVDSDGTTRNFTSSGQIPGLVMQELQAGEKPVAFRSQGTEESFGVFESAVIQAIAWANEVPPEILTLAFSNNYSASQAAINEFKIYLNKVWGQFGSEFCNPIYVEWLISEILNGKIDAPGLLSVWRNPLEQDVFGAWVSTDWYGSIKPSTDMQKQARGSKLLIEEGWSNNARESRTLTGTKFSKNMKRIKRENDLKAEALRPLLELRREFGNEASTVLGDS